MSMQLAVEMFKEERGTINALAIVHGKGQIIDAMMTANAVQVLIVQHLDTAKIVDLINKSILNANIYFKNISLS